MSYTQDDEDEDESSLSSDENDKSCSSPKLAPSVSLSKAAAHNAEVLSKLVELGMTADDLKLGQRKEFVAKLAKIWQDFAIQCRNLPILSKQVLDLYELYEVVKEKEDLVRCARISGGRMCRMR